MKRTSKYILTADDYGACDFIDAAIKKAIIAGKINSVACFAVPFETDETKKKPLSQRIAELVEMREKYGVAIGLHFSLTAGRSNQSDVFSKGNTLTVKDEHDLHHYMRPAYDYPFDIIDEKDFRNEMESQIQTLKKCLGDIPIDSVSNHHGLVYMNNRLYDIYLDVAKQHGIPIRSPMLWRYAGLPYGNWDHAPMNPLMRQAIHLRLLDQIPNAKRYPERIAKAKLAKEKFTTCLVDEIYGQAYAENLEDLFASFDLGVFSAEFMFHLGDPELFNRHPDQKLRGIIPEAPWGIDAAYFYWREKEFDTLMGSTLPGNMVEKTCFNKLVAGDEELPEWYTDFHLTDF